MYYVCEILKLLENVVKSSAVSLFTPGNSAIQKLSVIIIYVYK